MGFGDKYEMLATATTDANGEFSITYTAIAASTNSQLNVKKSQGHSAYLGNLPQNVNLEETIYEYDNYFYTIKVKTNKIYTEKDTLFYALGPDQKYIIGPFSDNQIIDTVKRSSGQIWVTGRSGPTSNVQYIWKLGSRYEDSNWGNKVNTLLVPCKKYNEVILDLTKAVE